MQRKTLFLALIAVGISVGSAISRATRSEDFLPERRSGAVRSLSTAETLPISYPGGGTLAIVPIPTKIAPDQAIFVGQNTAEISQHYIHILQQGPKPMAEGTIELLRATEIKPQDSTLLGVQGGLISAQSPTDLALVFQGRFRNAVPGYGHPQPQPYLLLIVDTYSGDVRYQLQSASFEEINMKLPINDGEASP